MPFATVFQLYRDGQCFYPCFPGVPLTSIPIGYEFYLDKNEFDPYLPKFRMFTIKGTEFNWLILSQNLDSSKPIGFADINFKVDENGGKFYKMVENRVEK